MVPFVEVDTNNDTCISKEEFDNSTYNSLIFFQVVEPGPIEDQEEFAKQLFSTFAKVYNPPGAPPGDCEEDKVSEAEFNAIAYYFTGKPVDYGGGYGYEGGAEGGDGTAGGQGEDLSNYVECTITFPEPLSETEKFNVRKSYAKQAGVPVVNVEITEVKRRDTTYKVSVRAKDASDLAKVRTQLADSRTLIKVIQATVLIFPLRLASPAHLAGSLPYAALYAQTHLTPLPFHRACLCGRVLRVLPKSSHRKLSLIHPHLYMSLHRCTAKAPTTLGKNVVLPYQNIVTVKTGVLREIVTAPLLLSRRVSKWDFAGIRHTCAGWKGLENAMLNRACSQQSNICKK